MTAENWDWQILTFGELDSTNAEARRRAAEGDTGPLWIAARRQIDGKGRQGRSWASPSGNLFATLLRPVTGTASDAGRLSFATALAVADVVKALAPAGRVTLKWPNDVLLNNRKVSGILLETLPTRKGNPILLATGVGINLVAHPDVDRTAWPATNIADVAGAVPDFDYALSLLTTRLGHWIDLAERIGFEPVRKAWMASAARVGEIIEVRLPNRTLHGRFRDIDKDGVLILSTPAGTERISAGDVFFPEGT